jgi:uncharacterized protein (TIRG00374 family)
VNVKVGFNCLFLGVAAWSCTSFILVYFCSIFNLNIPFYQAVSIYPAAMLAGAVSFIPGGVGATEAVIVFILNEFGMPIAMATIIALMARFATLWLAMLSGILCTFVSSFMLTKSETEKSGYDNIDN